MRVFLKSLIKVYETATSFRLKKTIIEDTFCTDDYHEYQIPIVLKFIGLNINTTQRDHRRIAEKTRETLQMTSEKHTL